MKNNFHLKIVLMLGLVTLLTLPSSPTYGQEPGPTIVRSEQNASQKHSIHSSNNMSMTTYFIPRYVIGTGGVIGAINSNYIHNATTGETFVGGMQSTNNFLFTGFWHQLGFGPNAVDQDVGVSIPTRFELHQNYPNPFNPQTTIRYALPKEYLVTVEIFNVIGQRIRLLLNEQEQGPGTMQVVWDSQDDHGRMLGSGIYLYRITACSPSSGNDTAEILFQEIKKMLLVK